jgi:hypothetical protein
MNSRNFQIKYAKVIRLPQDWGHKLRLILVTFPKEEIKARLFKSQEWKSGQKYLHNILQIKKMKNILAQDRW